MKKLLIASAVLAITLPAHAVLYVDWGGNYTTANQAMQRNPGTTPVTTGNIGGNGTQDVWTISTVDQTNAMSPSSGYTGPTFYGGAQAIRYDSFGTSSSNGITMRIHENGSNDLMRWQYLVPGSVPAEWVAVTLFTKPDFINGGSGATVTINGTSSLSLTVNAFNTLPAASTLRFVIQDGSQYYVSNSTATLTSGAGSTFTLSGAALTSETWAAYNPSSSDLRLPTTGFSPHSFTDITSVGLAWDVNNTALGETWNLTISDFEFNAVPEPSTLLLLAGGLTSLMAFRRRRIS
jgi:hypothetical protein